MAYCKFCEKEIEPIIKGNRYYCPDCSKYVKVDKGEREEPQVSEAEESNEENEEKPEREKKHYKKKEPEEIQEGPSKLIIAPKTIKYDASDLHMGEILINLGFAKDLNDLARKNMKLAYSLLNMGAIGKQVNAMELNESKKQDDTSEIIDKSLKQQLLQAQIDNMKKGGQQGQVADPLSTMMLMRMMENQDKGKSSGDNGFMNQLMMMQMQAMAKPHEDSNLRGEIAELKHQMQMQQMMNQQSQMQQGNTSSQQFMQKMEAIRAERDKEIKAAEIMAQQERDKNLSLAFDNRRIELESKLNEMKKEMQQTGSGQLATQRIKQMKEEISAIKEMSRELGGKEKSAGEYIGETISNVAGQLQPAMTKYIEQREQQRVMQQQIPRLPPEAEIIEQPMQNHEPQPSDMTETEQQMADQMSDMYLRKR